MFKNPDLKHLKGADNDKSPIFLGSQGKNNYEKKKKESYDSRRN